MSVAGTHQPPIGSGNAQVMNRFELTKRLVAKLPGEEAVVGGIGNTNFDLWSAGQRPQNFYMLGSMGLACPIALGVALAQPQRKVVALEGDGSLLMQLGCLATIAAVQPKNLIIVVMDNQSYQITGLQPTATAFGTDFVTIARGAGIGQSAWAADEEMLDELFTRALAQDGPWFIAARIDDRPGVGATDRDPPRITDRFMRGLGTKN
jgi:thiamine pyrophosphate-dependent acetolactate synthase large subunit-like protein